GGAIIIWDGCTSINNTNLTNNMVYTHDTSELSGGYYTEMSGGAIDNRGNLTVTYSMLNNNFIDAPEGHGGAIFNFMGTMTLNHTTMEDNNATNGGAIFAYAGSNDDQVVQSSQYFSNSEDSTNHYGITITNSILKNNKALLGGAIYNNFVFIDINNVTLNNNSAFAGGAIYNFAYPEQYPQGRLQYNNMYLLGVINLTDSRLTNNNASYGGAIRNIGGNLIVNNTTLEKNNATGYGGAIETGNGVVIIENATLNNNTANRGGAIHNTVFEMITVVSDETTKKVKSIKTQPNTADEILPVSYSNVFITDTTLKNNKAVIGGAIYNEKGMLNVTESVFTNNTAANASAISNYDKASIYNNTFKTNKANMKGKAIINDGNAEIRDNINDEISIYYGTIYTKAEDVSVIRNIFDDGILYTTIEITVNNSNPNVFDEVEVSLLFKDHFNRTIPSQLINLKIGDKTYNVTTKTDGTATQKHTLTTNVTDVIATFAGNDVYNKTSNSTVINAKKLNTKISLTTSNSTPLNNTPITITATLKDSKNNNVSGQNIQLNIAGKSVTVKTNASGIATYKYTPTKVETQTINATFAENNQYTGSTASTKITVKKLNTKLTLNVSNSTPLNATPINVTVTLTDSNNKAVANQNVTLNIAGKDYTVKTNNNGVAVQAYTPTKVETQSIKATYNGNSQNNNSTATTIITVKKLNTKLALKVSSTSPVMNTSISITVTLTDANNKPVANQNVTLKVAGNTFTVKTNSNGTAVQSYTPNKAENQTITATYNGNSQLNNSTATAKITVKKINTKITLKVSNSTPVKDTTINITATLTDSNNNKLA
ncbi:MAG: hypothetical protein BZ137_03655, partial [Methanosphaera sp. rholeuAM130]